MKLRSRVNWAALGLAGALACAAPAFAQDSAVTAAPPTPAGPREDVIGPPQLSGFSLNGTVTRRAETTPARTQPAAPAPRTATPAPPQQRRPAQAEAPAAPRPRAPAEQQAPSTEPSLDFGQPTPARVPPLAFPSDALGAEPASSSPIGSFASAESESGGGLAALLPWLIALLAAVGAAAWYLRRQRPGLALAGAGGNASAFDLSPAPEQVPAQPRAPAPPVPAPPSAAPAGIVSTRLRPWLEISFVPDFVEIDGDRAVIHFEVAVFNSGSAPARDVLIEAVLFNAGADQDEAIEAFFARPVGKGETAPVLGPLRRMNFRHSVTMTRDKMRIFEVEGRKLFVPLIGFNALYGWSGGRGQTSMSYLIGRDTDGQKMAPFRADLGARTFRGLAAREHTIRVRK